MTDIDKARRLMWGTAVVGTLGVLGGVILFLGGEPVLGVVWLGCAAICGWLFIVNLKIARGRL